MIRAVLFDLDGTLLLHDYDAFQPRYVKLIVERFSPHAPGKDVLQAFMDGVAAVMMPGDGSNVARFVRAFGEALGVPDDVLWRVSDDMYTHHFPKLGAALEGDPAARDVLTACRARRLTTVLATNPLFPRVAIVERLRWAGLTPDDLDAITTGEDYDVAKPSRAYFKEIARRIDVAPAECLVVGNDVKMDLAPAAALGMRTFLVDNAFAVRNVDGFTPDHMRPLAALPEVLAGL